MEATPLFLSASIATMTRHLNKCNALLITVLGIYWILNSANAGEINQPESNWTTTTAGGLVRTIVRGNSVYAHQFGMVKHIATCDRDLLWVVWTSGSSDLAQFQGSDATIRFRIGTESFDLDIPILSVREATPITTTLTFTNFVIGDKFIALLNRENRALLQIVAPISLVEALDIASDSFGLGGFDEAHSKSKQICVES